MKVGKEIKKRKKQDFNDNYSQLNEELKIVRQFEGKSIEELQVHKDSLTKKENEIINNQIKRNKKIKNRYSPKNNLFFAYSVVSCLVIGICFTAILYSIFANPVLNLIAFCLPMGSMGSIVAYSNLRNFIKNNSENKKLKQIDKTKKNIYNIIESKENNQVLSTKLEKAVEDLKETQPSRFAVLKKITGIKSQKDTKQERTEDTQPKSKLEHERV